MNPQERRTVLETPTARVLPVRNDPLVCMRDAQRLVNRRELSESVRLRNWQPSGVLPRDSIAPMVNVNLSACSGC